MWLVLAGSRRPGRYLADPGAAPGAALAGFRPLFFGTSSTAARVVDEGTESEEAADLRPVMLPIRDTCAGPYRAGCVRAAREPLTPWRDSGFVEDVPR